MSTHNRNTAGLVPFSPAADNPENLVLASVKIQAKDKALLIATPEGLSYHVRQALRQYLGRRSVERDERDLKPWEWE
jgi:hypothetical protein